MTDRDEIRRRAVARAVRMGLATPEPAPETEQAEAELDVLPKGLRDHPVALRAMLATGRLDQAQTAAARDHLAHLDAQAREYQPIHHFPGDAA